MIKIKRAFIQNATIEKVFNYALYRYSNKILLSHPTIKNKEYAKCYSYYDVNKSIQNYIKFFNSIGVHKEDRVAVAIGNIPEYFIIKLSLNFIGASIVPINCDLNYKEIIYILTDSNSVLVLHSKKYSKLILKALKALKKKIGRIKFNNNNELELVNYFKKKAKKSKKKINPQFESSLLYTSGTTGKPKGCILTHDYEINAGFHYSTRRGLINIKRSKERLYNCLPVHHVNSSVLSFFAMLLTGNCQIQGERFSVKNFWKEVSLSNATIFHYLGVMAPLLLKQRDNIYSKNNALRIGIGAGIEPKLHRLFENRFKVPMIELWGMTEMVRCIFDNSKNRIVGKRCFGKPDNNIKIKILNNSNKKNYPISGEMLVKTSLTLRKKIFFKGYLNNSKATKKVWENGWFHTGDLVTKDKNGKLYFIDRKKHIIRRAGENISSAEVEAALLNIDYVQNCAVTAVSNEIYEEEVFAFVVLNNKQKTLNQAKKILRILNKDLSYFKLPAFIKYIDSVPTTSTQKTEKSKLLKLIKDSNSSDILDLLDYKRSLKG